MPITVLLDVDKTLRMKQGPIYVVNQPLITQLLAHGITKVHLLTNMGLEDSSPSNRQAGMPTDAERLTRKLLINELKRQGIEVISVFTVADVAYGKAPGDAYEDLYKTAYEITDAEAHLVMRNEWNRLAGTPYEQATKKLKTEGERAAYGKEHAFRYFMDKHPDKDKIKTMIYGDDDTDCLDKITSVAKEYGISIKEIPVNPETYTTDEENIKYDTLLSVAYPFGKALALYKTQIGSYSWWSRHTVNGLQRAEAFVDFMDKITDPQQRAAEITKFLTAGKDNKKDTYSFKTILLTQLRGKDIFNKADLNTVAADFPNQLEYYKEAKELEDAIPSSSSSPN